MRSPGGATFPAAKYLFEMDPKYKKLPEKHPHGVHTCVAKLLFLCKRASPYIHVPVLCLTSKVGEPITDNKKKLVRVLKCLQDVWDMALILSDIIQT